MIGSRPVRFFNRCSSCRKPLIKVHSIAIHGRDSSARTGRSGYCTGRRHAARKIVGQAGGAAERIDRQDRAAEWIVGRATRRDLAKIPGGRHAAVSKLLTRSVPLAFTIFLTCPAIRPKSQIARQVIVSGRSSIATSRVQRLVGLGSGAP